MPTCFFSSGFCTRPTCPLARQYENAGLPLSACALASVDTLLLYLADGVHSSLEKNRSPSTDLTLMGISHPYFFRFPQVASIPRRACLSSDAEDAPAGTLRALAHALMASIPPCAAVEEDGASETAVAVVTLQVCLERFAGARSALAPWMALLNGKGDLNLPALWPASDLEALKGTLVLQEVEGCLARAEMERNMVAAAFANVLREEVEPGREAVAETDKLLGSQWLDSKGMVGRPTHREWLHARCTVQSRAYRVGQR